MKKITASNQKEFSEFEKIPLIKTRKEILIELTNYLKTSKFIISDVIEIDEFKLCQFKNNYSFYNETVENIYIIKASVLTEEQYNIMKEKLLCEENKRKGALLIVLVNEYNDFFEKYLNEFLFMTFRSRNLPVSILNLGISFKEQHIYIGSLNENTQYNRGRECQRIFFQRIKKYNSKT